MSEEALLILKMVREGKITPEQGVAFLDALKQNTAASSAGPDPFPNSSGGAGTWRTASHAQQVLAQLQQQLAEMQAKIGAAQAGSGVESTHSSKVKLPFGIGEVNITQILDDAMKGVSALRSEAVISAKKAARQAQKEARRFRAEAERVGKNIHVEVYVRTEERPRNSAGWPEASAREEITLDLPDDGLFAIRNRYGDVKVAGGSVDDSVHVTAEKTVWAGSVGDREEGLRNIRIEEVLRPDAIGRELIVSLPDDIGVDHASVNLTVQVPSRARVEAFTTYGDVHCESIEGGVSRVETASGNVRLLHIYGAGGASGSNSDSKIHTHSGSISINQWRAGALSIACASGEIRLDTIEAPKLEVRAASGDVHARALKVDGDLRFEALSGDLEIEEAGAGGSVFAKTQSGDQSLKSVNTGSLTLDSVSGDVIVQGAAASTGAVSIRAISGDLDVTGLAGREVSLNATSGDVTVAMAAEFDGMIACATVSGDVLLSLPTSYRARLTMTTHSGDVKCGFALGNREGDGEHYLNGVIGDAASVSSSATLQSVSGDLSIAQLA